MQKLYGSINFNDILGHAYHIFNLYDNFSHIPDAAVFLAWLFSCRRLCDGATVFLMLVMVQTLL